MIMPEGTVKWSEIRPPEQDQTLLERIVEGDAEALGLLYDRYGRQVFNAALRVVGDYGLAEEVTQDTFLRLWECAGQYRAERASLLTWLRTIARRRAIDELRGRRAASQRREVPLDAVLPSAAADDHMGLIQLYVDLCRVLAELPPAQREVLTLMLFAGMSRQEIARRLGCPPATIYTRYRIGLQRLRASL
jgi:RNA polymerase sigma-70 factor (ECF subfamily)